MNREAEFSAYMKAASHTSGDQGSSHLSEAEMFAYCRAEVSAAEQEAIQDHLVICDQCIALFRSARDFLDPARADEEEVTAAQTNEAWQEFRQRQQIGSTLRAGTAATSVVEADFQARDRKKRPVSRITLALAACLLISFGAFGWLAWSFRQEREARRQSQAVALQLENKQRELQQQLAQLEQSNGEQIKREREQRLAAEAERDELLSAVPPVRNVTQVVSLTLSSERGSENELLLPLKAATLAVRMRLFRSKPYEFDRYSIELLNQSGQVVWETAGLRPSPRDGALIVLLNRAKLSPGKHTLRLFSGQGRTQQRLGDYPLLVTAH
jgi:hypothetical protein